MNLTIRIGSSVKHLMSGRHCSEQPWVLNNDQNNNGKDYVKCGTYIDTH